MTLRQYAKEHPSVSLDIRQRTGRYGNVRLVDGFFPSGSEVAKWDYKWVDYEASFIGTIAHHLVLIIVE